VREALFSILGPRVQQANVLDLFAGTGALGLEALSRGAARVTLVERSRTALPVLMRNVAAVGLAGTDIVAMDATRALSRLAAAAQRFDLVFLDPPYALNLLAPTLADIVANDLLLPRATIVCEHSSRDSAPPAPASLRHIQTRSFGDVALSFFEVQTR
jgi:16S rRNA (guanine(966)-N(2))-methyltransferase RsmD